MQLSKKIAAAVSLVLVLLGGNAALAAPPVRIAIVAGSSSGQEQDVIDGITSHLEGNANVTVSTVNPDWIAVVNISDKQDLVAANVRVNGNIVIKTGDGQVISTSSAQTNKQDFNLSPGSAQPVNRVLVDNAIKEVISGLIERGTNAINQAAEIEVNTRDKIIAAMQAANEDKYDDALNSLSAVTRDTPHWNAVQKLIAQDQIEKAAFDHMNAAVSASRSGRLAAALSELKGVDAKSKRYAKAKVMIADIRRRMTAGAHKSAPPSKADALSALALQKNALQKQQQAIEAQENALKGKSK